MSLQVWLPLNGNLINKGLANITIENNGAIVKTDGKFGSCYNLPSAWKYIKCSGLTSITNLAWSVAAWVYPTTDSPSTNQYIVSMNTSTQSDFKLGINWYTNKFGIKIGDPSYLTPSTYTINNWYHVCGTYDGTSVKIYINGILVSTQTPTATTVEPTDVYIGMRGGTGGQYTGRINDVRIYDHTLSAKEVKEISKGLILHYTLDQNIQQMNNCFNSPTFDTSAASGGWNHWGNTGHGGTYGQNTDKAFIYNKSRTYSHWVANSSSATATYLCYQSPTFEGGFRSLQAIIKEEHGYPITERIVYPGWNANISGGAATGLWTSITPLGDGFYLCKCEGLKQDGSNDLVSIITRPGYKIYISEAYLENDREICTDIFDPNTITVYDSSGLGNNGTITGALIMNPDSPRSKYSTRFSSGEYIDCGRGGCVIDEITVSAWAYMDDWSTLTSAARLCSCAETGGFNFSKFHSSIQFSIYVSGVGYKAGASGIEASALTSGWHLFTGTYDGFTVKIYIDGVLKGSSASSDLKTPASYHATYPVYLNREAPSGGEGLFNGISDFRVYATALSADDIKALYNSPISIDKNGNIYAQCYEEME